MAAGRGDRGAEGRIDVSMPLFEGMPAFPGDPPFRRAPFRAIARGDPYDLSTIGLGSHAGTHVDPPSHFLTRGMSVDRLELDRLNGAAHVLHVPADAVSIGPDELRSVPAGVERLLLRTANSDRWARRLEFFEGYVALTSAGAALLVQRQVRCVGIDALSIESDMSGAFPVHRTLLGNGIPILEGLLLGGAPAGPYELECLPLLIRDGDGAPARAVLRPR
ncbi:MAG: cyclase family protein [Thermoplasmata archaeon]